MSDVEWRTVVGYEGLYEVSNTGLVRSVDRFVRHRKGGYHHRRSVVLRPGSHKRDGRPFVALYRDGASASLKVARLVAEAFIGPCPPNMGCCHNDGDVNNSHVTNLRWDTHSGNMRDAVRHGTNKNASKTHCKNGHEYTPENTRIGSSPNGRQRRTCRACYRIWRAEHEQRRKAMS